MGIHRLLRIPEIPASELLSKDAASGTVFISSASLSVFSFLPELNFSSGWYLRTRTEKSTKE
jgi:hypothetical protein